MSRSRVGRVSVLPRAAIGVGVALAIALTGGPARAVGTSATSPQPRSQTAPAVEPALRSWAGSTGDFTLTPGSRIVAADAGLSAEARIFGGDLSQIVGRRIPTVVHERPRPGDITLNRTATAPGNAEGYRLRIADTVSIEAANTTGLSHGEQTVEQLFTLDAGRAHIPRGVAQDWPQVQQRGLMIDAGRKYYQPSSVEQLIRTAAWYKLNTVHLHLTEYNAFRLNSPKFPGLAAAQSYSHSDIDHFEQVAGRYHITIIPEIDLPAHASALTAYWPNTTWDCAPMNEERGHNFTLDVTKPATLKDVKQLLDEFIPWFKGPVFHIGTDEYPYQSTQEQCPELVDYAKTHHFANTSDVMVTFINYLNTIVRSHGKTAEAWGWWDAAGQPTISPDKNIIVEAYGNNTDSAGRAGDQHFLDEGYQVVYADGDQLYVTPGLQLLPNDQALYSQWPAVDNPKLRGYMMSRWSDGTETATDAFQNWYADRPQVVVADRSWGGPVQGTALDLENRVDAIGPPPGVPGPSPDAVKLTGTPYGSAALDSGHQAQAVFDGDPGTFFDAADANGAYAGIDLGHATTVTKIRLLPRSNQPARMTGGTFQGCTDGPASGCVTLATIPWNPATFDWRQLTVSDTTPYRWLRYVSPNGGHGNVAEVEFYTSPAQDASIELNAPAGLRALGANTVNATVTNLTARTIEHATAAITVNPVDGGSPLTVRPEGSATLPAIAPHQSATMRWHVDVPLDAIPGAYRVNGTVETPNGAGTDRANTSMLASIGAALTATVTPTPVDVTATGSATATLELKSTAALPLTIHWKAAPTHFQITPRSGVVRIPAAGNGSVRLSISGVPSTPGVTSIPIAVSSGPLKLASPNLQISVPYNDLAGAFNNVGITSDDNVDAPNLNGGIDGDGSSYSQQALAAAGAQPGLPFSHGGVTFTWPAAPSGAPDNVIATGQTILVGKSGHTLGLLTAATYVAPGTFSGTGTVTYTDGTSAPFNLAIPEWQRAYSAPADEAITMNYHNYAPAGQVNTSTHLFFTGVALDPGKTVASVTLPQGGAGRAALHVFALGVN
jgi:Glycosyl hydrolase family 20, catalytic domain/Glycosyl hydrolase family 20, domain 2